MRGGCMLDDISSVDSFLQSSVDDLCYLGVLWRAVINVGFSMQAAVDMRTESTGIAVQAGVKWCEGSIIEMDHTIFWDGGGGGGRHGGGDRDGHGHGGENGDEDGDGDEDGEMEVEVEVDMEVEIEMDMDMENNFRKSTTSGGRRRSVTDVDQGPDVDQLTTISQHPGLACWELGLG
ncbi:hypothetical protein E2320_012175 [Naja naja]|nr:hypothetical protein E2320_012175 [Naja naja]